MGRSASLFRPGPWPGYHCLLSRIAGWRRGCRSASPAQPTISHHLKVLREAGIITSERRGTWVYYRLVPAALERMAGLFSVTGS